MNGRSMKLIELTQNKCAQVDDVVYEWLHCYNWHLNQGENTQYARRHVKVDIDGLPRTILLHRMIAGVPSPYRIRFKNGKSLDCQAENLQIVDSDDNIIEWECSCGATHFNGVRWDGWYGLWRAELDSMIIGYTITEIEAAMKYNEKAKKYLPSTINNLRFLHG
jgi:hypothetical protein